MSQLEPGAEAPDFSLVDQTGKTFHLAGSLKSRQGMHLIYFYPKADTPGCTTQACGLRDVAGEVGDVLIVGISPDSPDKQARFDQKHNLGFPLLSDADHTVADAYGVWGERSLYGRKFMGIVRSAFLVDEKGRIAEAWYKISPKDTPVRLTRWVAGAGRA